MILPLIYPFCRLHVRSKDVQRLCFVLSSLKDPVRRAAYYNADVMNLVRCLDERAQRRLSFKDVLPLLVRDRTPGLYLCEVHTPRSDSLWLAARLGAPESPEEPKRLAVPALVCEASPAARELAARLAAVSPEAAVFLDGDVRYTVKPVHDPLACSALCEAFAESPLKEPEADRSLTGHVVRLLIDENLNDEKTADFPSGLLVD